MTAVRELQGVTIAFDIDGTLFDPDGSAYQTTTRALLAAMDLGLDESSAWKAYESLRLMGRAIESLELPNPNHFRGHAETLASLFILFADASRLPRVTRLSPLVRDVMHESLSRLDEAMPARGESDWRKRLAAERQARALLKSDVSLEMFRDEVLRVASLSPIADWPAHFAEIESETPLHDPTPLLDALVQRGAHLVVISEGLEVVQRAKLARLGVQDHFINRVFITQAAGQIVGLDELDRTLQPFLEAPDGDFDDASRTELSDLWRMRCIVHLWATKSPWFFGRCLHAIRANPGAPTVALKELAIVPRDQWLRESLRFVMIGDRYDRDVAPLQALVGPSECMTLRLEAGRYAGEFVESELPANRRPSRTFSNWDALSNYLTHELSRDAVPMLNLQPDIVETSSLDAEWPARVGKHSFDSVRSIVRAIAESKV